MADMAIQKRDTQQVNVAERTPERMPERMEDSITFTPLVDIIETNDEFVFQADLPGVKAGDVDVSYENGTLTISAKAEPRQHGQIDYIWQEYGVGNFYRQFTLSTPINPDGIKAGLTNGVLELHVP